MPPSPNALWSDLAAGVRAYVARRVPPSDVDDVTQDVLLRLSASADRVAAAANVHAWATAVARRTVADFYRSRARLPATERHAREPASEAPLPGENLSVYRGTHDVHEEVLSWLRPMAEALPAPYADALVRADFEGQPQQAVADALGLSLSGAKSRVQRARVLLARSLRACCDVAFGPDGRARAFERVGRVEACDACPQRDTCS